MGNGNGEAPRSLPESGNLDLKGMISLRKPATAWASVAQVGDAVVWALADPVPLHGKRAETAASALECNCKGVLAYPLRVGICRLLCRKADIGVRNRPSRGMPVRPTSKLEWIRHKAAKPQIYDSDHKIGPCSLQNRELCQSSNLAYFTYFN